MKLCVCLFLDFEYICAYLCSYMYVYVVRIDLSASKCGWIDFFGVASTGFVFNAPHKHAPRACCRWSWWWWRRCARATASALVLVRNRRVKYMRPRSVQGCATFDMTFWAQHSSRRCGEHTHFFCVAGVQRSSFAPSFDLSTRGEAPVHNAAYACWTTAEVCRLRYSCGFMLESFVFARVRKGLVERAFIRAVQGRAFWACIVACVLRSRWRFVGNEMKRKLYGQR